MPQRQMASASAKMLRLECRIILFACLLLAAAAAATTTATLALGTSRTDTPLEIETNDRLIVEEAPERLLDWQRYQRFYKRHYKTLTERAFRFTQFLSHWLRVAASRIAFRHRKLPYYLEVNRFSDQTSGELRARYGAKPSIGDEQMGAAKSSTESENENENNSIRELHHHLQRRGANFFSNILQPAKKRNDELMIDHRASGCLAGEQIDQGECGSCYAMASTKLFEWLYCNQRAQRDKGFVKFSEQIMIDCGRRTGLKGCEQGSREAALRFIDSYGLLPADRYPYVGTDQSCPLDSNAELAREMEARKPRERQLKVLKLGEWVAELQRQPLLVFLFLDDDLWEFGGGLFSYRKREPKKAPQCDKSLGHFMLLVGHGKEDGQEYWLLANSYGAQWGDGGYLKLAKSGDDCIGYVLSVSAKF